MLERVVESPGGSHPHSSFDPHDAIVATGLDHLRVENGGAEDTPDDRPVELESVRDDQGPGHEVHPRRDVANERQRIPVAASPDDGRRPETRPDVDRRENPRRPGLAAGERADLVDLKLLNDDAGGPVVVESTTYVGGSVESAGDGVPGQPFDSGDRGYADALDSERDDRVEHHSAMLETVVGRAFRRRERLAAFDAPVSTTFSSRRSVESVADDAASPDFAMQRTFGVETAQLLHFAWALSTKELRRSK